MIHSRLVTYDGIHVLRAPGRELELRGESQEARPQLVSLRLTREEVKRVHHEIGRWLEDDLP